MHMSQLAAWERFAAGAGAVVGDAAVAVAAAAAAVATVADSI